MPDEAPPLPEFVSWPTFPFEGDIRVKAVDPLTEEPPRQGEDPSTCTTCSAPDDAYVWVAARWRVRALDRPTGLPMVLILESRSHLDLGDLPNLLAAELGVMVVRLERAIRSLEGVARVHVNRWGDGSAHLHLWFLARPYGRLQLRGTFLSLWDDILPPIPEDEWRNNLALVAAWLADFGGRAVAAPSRIDWKSFSTLAEEGAKLQLDLERDAPTDVPGGTDPASDEPEEQAPEADPTVALASAGDDAAAGEPGGAAEEAGAADGASTGDQAFTGDQASTGDAGASEPGPAPGVLDEWAIPDSSPGSEEPTTPVEAPKATKPRAPRKRAPRKAAPTADAPKDDSSSPSATDSEPGSANASLPGAETPSLDSAGTEPPTVTPSGASTPPHAE